LAAPDPLGNPPHSLYAALTGYTRNLADELSYRHVI
jgi:hypothetical protein